MVQELVRHQQIMLWLVKQVRLKLFSTRNIPVTSG